MSRTPSAYGVVSPGTKRSDGRPAVEGDLMSEGAGGLRLKVHGLDCAEEVASLRREVGPVVGGEDRLSFDVLGGTMTVEAPTPPGAVITAIARTEMRAGARRCV